MVCRGGENFTKSDNLTTIRHAYYSRVYKILQSHKITIFRGVKALAYCFSLEK